MNNLKPWFQLNPNECNERWWRITEIIDETNKPNIEDVECYYIIQDCNMCGNFWHISSWYVNCPNRYSITIYENEWFFNKKLYEILEGDIVYLNNDFNIKFKAYNSKYTYDEQIKFCKILVRI